MNTTAQQLAQQIANQNANAAKQGSADQAQEASVKSQANVPPAPTPAPQETDKAETPAQSNPDQNPASITVPAQELKDFKPEPGKVISLSDAPTVKGVNLGDTVIFYPAPDTQPFRKQKTVAAIVTEVTTPTTVSLTAFGKGFTEPVPYNNVPLKTEEGQTYCFSQK